MTRFFLMPALCVFAGSLAAQDYDLDTLLSVPRVGTVKYVSGKGVDADMRQIVRDSLSGVPYFGAFARHPSGAYGYATEANSVAGAEASALRFCADVSDFDGQCRIIARLVPKGLSPDAYPTISPNIADGIIEVMGLNNDGFAALAASGDGAWGSALNAQTTEAAIDVALESCESWRLSGGETPLEGFPCEVVIVVHSDVVLPE